MVSQRERTGMDGRGGLARLSVRVDTDTTEIMSESALHMFPRGRAQRPAGGSQHLLHRGWNAESTSGASW